MNSKQQTKDYGFNVSYHTKEFFRNRVNELIEFVTEHFSEVSPTVELFDGVIEEEFTNGVIKVDICIGDDTYNLYFEYADDGHFWYFDDTDPTSGRYFFESSIAIGSYGDDHFITSDNINKYDVVDFISEHSSLI